MRPRTTGHENLRGTLYGHVAPSLVLV